ncbi:putative membrane protein [Wickerhamomyces ciferrii]|uniref:Membrane protein n=1 Tax=Wickerhamomyces ciferrii (strain ATCC 14091 / BCRC 22168 / CBS 111 / JCM 3599 / NBRC 0793 / NRRL Y-1031 F-60-10) TaxID=1206466 RepID=K0KLI7_WICCF|nr:uncharacterized protein BN7_5713 [Wickerhamomyces ciferrii]CCH46125.1 putative membrane protein [Wickerhamomyces ciferrii]
MKFDITIPVITLRVVLIVLTVLSISFGVLFPLSFLSFNYFYNYMIPIPTIRLPFSHYILNYDFKDIPPFIIISKELESVYGNQQNPNIPYPLDDFELDLNYDFQLLFKPYCKNNQNSYEPLMYKITIVTDHLVNQLSPYGNRAYISKRFHLWPVTNNIHQLHNQHVLVSSMNSIILKCGEEKQPINHKVDSLIPPVLKWFVPPVISDFEYSKDDSRLKVDLLKDINLENYINSENSELFKSTENINIVVEFNRPDVIIDPNESEIIISSAWKGIRYYLYHYRVISYILGVFILWTISSDVLVLTVSLLILVRELRSEAQEIVDHEQENTEMIDDDDLTLAQRSTKDDAIRLRRGSQGELYGRDNNNGIDFRVDVHETVTSTESSGEGPLEQSSQVSSENATTSSTP